MNFDVCTAHTKKGFGTDKLVCWIVGQKKSFVEQKNSFGEQKNSFVGQKRLPLVNCTFYRTEMSQRPHSPITGSACSTPLLDSWTKIVQLLGLDSWTKLDTARLPTAGKLDQDFQIVQLLGKDWKVGQLDQGQACPIFFFSSVNSTYC